MYYSNMTGSELRIVLIFTFYILCFHRMRIVLKKVENRRRGEGSPHFAPYAGN